VRRGGQRRLAWLCPCIAPYSRASPLTSLSVFLPSLTIPSPPRRGHSLPFVLARCGTMRLRCANDRAADIGNYSLRNSRVHLLRPPLSLLLPALSSPIVLACPSRLLFPLLDALSSLPAPLADGTDTARSACSPLATGAATLIYKRLRGAQRLLIVPRAQSSLSFQIMSRIHLAADPLSPPG